MSKRKNQGSRQPPRISEKPRSRGDVVSKQPFHGLILTTRSSIFLLLAATATFLVPFLNKAFHIDDPLFIWAAKQIRSHPLDFYGFNVNWYGAETSMAETMKNPPLTSYYLALIGPWAGWQEIGLHLALILPAFAAAVGTYYLARNLCDAPVLAALASLLTPVFVLCGSTVMSDMMMLALWIWSIVWWRQGMEQNRWTMLGAGSVLAGLCGLTKYFGICLVPLLFVYSVAHRRRVGIWPVFLLLPILIFIGYQLGTGHLYGRGLLTDAATYAATTRFDHNIGLLPQLAIGLVFVGGCVFSFLLYVPWCWSRKMLLAWCSFFVILAFGLANRASFADFSLRNAGETNWLLTIQIALFFTAGANLLSTAFMDFQKNRDSDSLLLTLWIIGTFLFATAFNWTVSGRNILPIAPAAGILLVRRLRARRMLVAGGLPHRLTWPLLVAATVTLLVTSSDHRWANTARAAATEITGRYLNQAGTLWFQGHWGFQYYMQNLGGRPVDVTTGVISEGDSIVTPENNSNVHLPRAEVTHLSDHFKYPLRSAVATSSASVGAGFYSSIWGPLPFALGRLPAEGYYVHKLELSMEKGRTASKPKSVSVVQVLQLSRDNAESHFDTAYGLALRGKVDEAMTHYRIALRMRSSYPEAHMNLGVLLAEKGRIDEALDHYHDALRIKPDYAEAHINMGIELAGQSRLAEAIDHFSEAAKIKPGLPEAHFNLGKAYVVTGKRGAALEQLRVLSQINSKYASQLKVMIDSR